MRNICISGIHTDVGKSCVSAALCQAFGYEYFKLVQAGSATDRDFVAKIAPNVVSHEPGAMLQTAASPHVGMKLEGVRYDGLSLRAPAAERVLVELAGGLFCPLDFKNYMIDYLQSANLPTFLVSRNYLGSINHTILSIEALKSRGIEILGVIFSLEKDDATREFLREKYPNLNFFSLDDFGANFGNFETAAHNLKNQILSAGVKLS